MKLDETIKSLELSADTWQDPFTDKELRQIAKWLKELKKLREFKKHCKLGTRRSSASSRSSGC